MKGKFKIALTAPAHSATLNIIMEDKIKIEYVDINKLCPSDYNPRKSTQAEKLNG